MSDVSDIQLQLAAVCHVRCFAYNEGVDAHWTKGHTMTLQELEEYVSQLPPEQLAQFIEWVKELDSDLWDKQIESDVAAGRLDSLAADAIAEDDAGRTTPL